MHPDAVIAGLRRELERLDPKADDYKDRKKAIEEEVDRVDGLDRPITASEKPDAIVNHDRVYVEALKRELDRVGDNDDRREEITAELKRAEKALKAKGDEEVVLEPEEPKSEAEQAAAAKKAAAEQATPELSELTVAQLRDIAKDEGLSGGERLKKDELIDAINASRAANA